jgi:hypothetical protein
MSEKNVEIVRRIHEALAEGVNERSINGLLDAGLIAPDGEIDFRNAYPDGGVVRLATMAQFETEPRGTNRCVLRWSRLGRRAPTGFWPSCEPTQPAVKAGLRSTLGSRTSSPSAGASS